MLDVLFGSMPLRPGVGDHVKPAKDLVSGDMIQVAGFLHSFGVTHGSVESVANLDDGKVAVIVTPNGSPFIRVRVVYSAFNEVPIR